MIELRVLGGVELLGREGQPLHAVLAQPKRVGLLAYLALARPRGYVRRDILLALLWPELDEARARGALSKAVHHLRLALGPGVLEGRGRDELGLDWERFWCDAAGFEDALARGEAAEALALYRGELLPGFYVREAPEYEQWLERERARLQDGALQAARGLSEREAAAGDLGAAVEWARRASALSPYDEPAVCRLMLLLEAASGRGAALQAYDELAARLRDDLDLEPGAESRALRDAIRARERGPGQPPAEALAPPPPAAARIAPVAAAPPPLPAPPDVPGRRPPRLGARPLVAGAMVLLGLSALPWASRRAPPGFADVGRPATIAVFPFAVDGCRPDAGLAERVPELLTDRFASSPDLVPVHPDTVLRAASAPADGAPDIAAGRALARALRSRLGVAGRVTIEDTRVSIAATVFDTVSDGYPIAHALAVGSAEELERLVDQVAWQLLAADPARGRIMARGHVDESTTSAAALDAFVRGLAEMHAGRFGEASLSFRRAIEADSAYAFAYYGLSQTANWTGDWEVARWAATRARRHDHRLEPLDRLRVRAWDAYLMSRPLEAERLLRTMLANLPTDGDAWLTLGEVLFHWGPGLGWPIEDARYAFERALELSPYRVESIIHLARIAADRADVPALESLLARAEALELGATQRLELRALLAFAAGAATERERVIAELGPLDSRTVFSVVTMVAAHAVWRPESGRLAETLLAPRHGPRYQALGALLRAQAAATHGRWREAGELLRESAALPHARRVEFLAVLYGLPFVAPPEDELRAVRAELDDLPVTRVMSLFEDLHRDGVYPPRRDYLLAVLSVRLGDLAGAERHAGALERRTGVDDRDERFRDVLARLARAELLRAEGRPADALALLGEPAVRPDNVLPTIVSYDVAHERFLRAELLRERGRYREALRWYGTFPDPGAYDLPYLAPAAARAAELRHRLGEPDRARAEQARARELWRLADPEPLAWLEAALLGANM